MTIDRTPAYLTPDPREAKLPRYAQETLAELRLELDRERRRADEARLETQPGSDTFVSFFDREPVGLGNGTPVRFVLAEDRNPDQSWHYIDARVTRTDGRPVLQLMGGHGLTICPQATNVIDVRMES